MGPLCFTFYKTFAWRALGYWRNAAFIASTASLISLATSFPGSASWAAEIDPTPSSTASLPLTHEPIQIVDLHAHYFMSEASHLAIQGGFWEPLRAQNWSGRLKSKVNLQALNASGVRVAVVALYSHPLMPRSILASQRETIRRQIEATERLVKENPEWVIARSPSEAHKQLDAGKRILVLSIEGISGIIENDADIEEFIVRRGVRIVTPLHFTDDRMGGAALMPGAKIIANPWAALRSFMSPHRDAQGVRINPRGLTNEGRKIIKSLIARGVWIDLSHASDESFHDLLPMLQTVKQPLLYTHTVLRSAFGGERGISDEQLLEVKKSGGIVGLLPSDDMLEGTRVDSQFCPASCAGECSGGIAAFLTQYSQMLKILSPQQILLGSDINAPLTFLKPGCAAAEHEHPQGIYSYAQLRTLEEAIQSYGVTLNKNSELDLKTFLDAWNRLLLN